MNATTPMNYIKHLTAFFERIILDHTLNPTHISLYIALFQHWNVNRFQNPISITRDEIMRISKICSKATYHKCMRELHDKGYVKYEPSFNPFRGSMVHLFNFSEDLKPVQKKASINQKILPLAGQVVNKYQTSDKTTNEQALVPSINNTNKPNISNNSNLGEQTQNFENENILSKEKTANVFDESNKNEINNSQKEKSLAKKKVSKSNHHHSTR